MYSSRDRSEATDATKGEGTQTNVKHSTHLNCLHQQLLRYYNIHKSNVANLLYYGNRCS